MHIPTFVFIFILFLKNILLLLLYPKHVIKLLGYNLGCYTSGDNGAGGGIGASSAVDSGYVNQVDHGMSWAQENENYYATQD